VGQKDKAKSLRLLGDALARQSVVTRYWSHVSLVPGHDCVWWFGAISERGHGRFWLGTDAGGVIAHRFAYGLAFGIDELARAEVLDHECDNPLCQNVEHMVPTSVGGNRRRWAARRYQVGGPLRDVRGSRGRSLAIRDALKAGENVQAVLNAGLSEIDAGQGLLW